MHVLNKRSNIMQSVPIYAKDVKNVHVKVKASSKTAREAYFGLNNCTDS